MTTLLAKLNVWRKAAARVRQSTVLSFLLMFVVFLLVGTAISYRSLSYPWFSDDLHIVRVFSGSELRQVFTGNWDPDGIETSGYRPATILFNHVRAAILDESVVAHRLFQIALVAAYLSILALIAIELDMGLGVATFAGIFALCTKNNWWNLVWIADGIHAFVGLMIILAAYLILSAVRRFAFWKIALATVLAALGLFAREEALSMFPVILLLPCAYVFVRNVDLAKSPDQKEIAF